MALTPFKPRASFLVLPAVLSFAAIALGQDIAHLYWVSTDPGRIERARADGSGRETLTTRSFEIREVDLDVASGRVYYSGRPGDSFPDHLIYRANLDGTDRRLLVSEVTLIYDVALDLPGGKMYWSLNTPPTHSIRRSDLDGSDLETIVPSTRASDGLVVDSTAAKIYWSGVNGLKRADLDGSNEETLDSISGVYELAIDEANATLYAVSDAGVRICDVDRWSCVVADPSAATGVQVAGSTVYYQNRDTGEIWRMDLDGQNQQAVTTGLYPIQSGFAFDPVASHFYFGDGNVFRCDLDGSNQTPILSEVGEQTHDVAVDGANERFYVATGYNLFNVVGGSIVTPLTNGLFPGRTQEELLGDTRGLVLDDSTGQLYVVNFGTNGVPGVVRVGIDGSGPVALVTGLTNPHDIALDRQGGKLYWTTSIGGGGGTGAKIQRADLDGSNVEDVLVDLPLQVRGIDVDSSNGKIYWTDMAAGEIRRADLDGTSPETVLSGLVRPHDVALDPTADALYWIENIDDSQATTAILGRATLDGGSPVAIFTDLSQHTRDLTVVYHRPIPLFEDGFESGDTGAWSSVVQ